MAESVGHVHSTVNARDHQAEESDRDINSRVPHARKALYEPFERRFRVTSVCLKAAAAMSLSHIKRTMPLRRGLTSNRLVHGALRR